MRGWGVQDAHVQQAGSASEDIIRRCHGRQADDNLTIIAIELGSVEQKPGLRKRIRDTGVEIGTLFIFVALQVKSVNELHFQGYTALLKSLRAPPTPVDSPPLFKPPPPKGIKARPHFLLVSTTRPSWHFPAFHVPDADAGNARDATTQLTGTDPIFVLKILRLSGTQH